MHSQAVSDVLDGAGSPLKHGEDLASVTDELHFLVNATEISNHFSGRLKERAQLGQLLGRNAHRMFFGRRPGYRVELYAVWSDAVDAPGQFVDFVGGPVSSPTTNISSQNVTRTRAVMG